MVFIIPHVQLGFPLNLIFKNQCSSSIEHKLNHERGNRIITTLLLPLGHISNNAKAVLHMEKFGATTYCARTMLYMEEKVKKGQMHKARRTGNVQRRFEVCLKQKSGFGVCTQEITQEVIFYVQPDIIASCTCNKPTLLHKPCSHVLAAAAKTKMDTRPFVSYYFTKEAVRATWSGELFGYRVVDNFTQVPEGERYWIPDFSLLRVSVGRRQTRRITNSMDEGEAGGPTKQCLYCKKFGHRIKTCPVMKEDIRREEGCTAASGSGHQ